MKKKMKKKSSRKRLREYSKRVLALMIVLWFATAVFGACVTVYQIMRTSYEYGSYITLDGLYSFVGAPVAGGIVSYLIKSAMENKQKIKSGGNTCEQVEAPDESEVI